MAVTRENFEYVECQIPEPASGQVLVRNLLLSFDPTQRGWMEDKELPTPSRHWRTNARWFYNLSNRITSCRFCGRRTGTNDWRLAGLRRSNAKRRPHRFNQGARWRYPEMMLSVLGITGLTAYFGMLDLGTPKPVRQCWFRPPARQDPLQDKLPYQGLSRCRHASGAAKCAAKRRSKL